MSSPPRTIQCTGHRDADQQVARKSPVADDCDTHSSRRLFSRMRSHDARYKVSLVVSVLVDVILCAALLASLVYYFYNGKSFSPHYIVGFSAFFILFTGFFVSLMIAVHTKRIQAILVTVVFTVARFICAIIVVIAWLSEYGGRSEDEKNEGDESEDPYRWIANRKGYLLAFAALYILIFINQLIILNRIWNLLTFVTRHWIPILIGLVALIVLRTLFNNIVFPHYYESFKKCYGLERMLAEMKDVLEDDYHDLWHESEFCLAFLALQDEHQRLVNVAKSNENGENPRRFHWANRYAKIQIK